MAYPDFFSWRCYVSASHTDPPIVGASDIGHGSHGPENMRLGPGIDPRTRKKIALLGTGFEPQTRTPYKRSFNARSTKNTNIHVERVHNVHMEY